MFSFSTNRIFPTFHNLTRLYCFKRDRIDSALDFTVKDIFSPQEHAKILETLNESTPEALSRYKIPILRIKGMSDWKKKKGPFQSLSDVLEVEGFGEKMLEEICKNIAHNNTSEAKFRDTKQNKHARQLLIPEMSLHLSTSLRSAVAIHLDPTGIGWARLENEHNKLTNWKCDNFSSLPTKMLPSDTFNLAVDILKKTPCADAYIFEATPTLSPQNKTKQSLVSTHNHQIELVSMLMSLLNTSVQHNNSLQDFKAEEDYDTKSIENRVFYLRSRISARLFNVFIGNEKVSAISTIINIMRKDILALQSLPCTPVAFEPEMNHNFLSQSSTNKELLAQALMLGISFMDLCIRRNPISYEALRPKRYKRKEESLRLPNLS